MADLEFRVDTKELDDLIKDLGIFRVRTRISVRNTMRRYADRFQREVIANASGRPGPKQVTGKYVNSIYAKRGKDADNNYTITIGSDAPQAARLEYGFMGKDSMGRTYAQPPYPHFEPAKAKLEPEMMAALATALEKAWNKGDV